MENSFQNDLRQIFKDLGVLYILYFKNLLMILCCFWIDVVITQLHTLYIKAILKNLGVWN